MYFEDDVKWNVFEQSGKISDYIDYKGVQLYGHSANEGEYEGADENT